jgi:hypothetical protein
MKASSRGHLHLLPLLHATDRQSAPSPHHHGPRQPDVPRPVGAPLWLIAAVLLGLAGLALGAMLIVLTAASGGLVDAPAFVT